MPSSVHQELHQIISPLKRPHPGIKFCARPACLTAASAPETDTGQRRGPPHPGPGGSAAMECGSLKRLGGTYASPLPLPPMPACPAVEDIGNARLAALVAPCDYLALEKVAAVVGERYADVVWIRLDIADRDPGVLLVTLQGRQHG